jgi:L-amino acid N-acyltransferase YncA
MREVAGRSASDEDEERGLDRRALLTLADGTPVDIRPLDERDVGRLVNFFRHVPVEDRLFLREDVVVSDVVYNWVRNYGPQRSLVLVAEADGEIVGNVTIERQGAPWSRHVGELWVLVAREARGQGIGRRLIEEGFREALHLGLEKIVAPMTANQVAAIEIFRNLGFMPEAMLTGYVKDPRAGESHDLVIMARDVEAMGGQLSAIGLDEEEDEADTAEGPRGEKS